MGKKEIQSREPRDSHANAGAEESEAPAMEGKETPFETGKSRLKDARRSRVAA